MFKVAQTIADYVVMYRKAQEWTTIHADDDQDMHDLKESLYSVFVSLYKCMILATADLSISLNGNLQWLKGMTKHYDWAGQMDTLREEAQRVSDFLHIKEWQELHKRSLEGQKLPRRDSRINMGPGPRNPLHWAAALGVPDNVAHYVRNREYPVNALTEENWTAAHLAAQNGRPNVIKALATAPDIDFFIKDIEERTPLHLAAIHNRPMVAGILLDRSPELLFPRDKWGRTAFFLAAENGSVDVLDVFRNRGQDLNEITVENGWTALHLAVENRHPHAVDWLIQNGVDKEAKIRDGPEKGMTAKELAELRVRPRCVQLLQ
jgi:hypothetical protein